MSLNAFYDKEQQYVWFRCGVLNSFEIFSLYELERWGYPGDPQLVSLDAAYHKEQEYICLRGGVLNGF